MIWCAGRATEPAAEVEWLVRKRRQPSEGLAKAGWGRLIRPGVLAGMIVALLAVQLAALGVRDGLLRGGAVSDELPDRAVRRLAPAAAEAAARRSDRRLTWLSRRPAGPDVRAAASSERSARPADVASRPVPEKARPGSAPQQASTSAGGLRALDPGAGRRAASRSSSEDDRAKDKGSARRRFERQFPQQTAATQRPDRDPSTAFWAVLIGINEHEAPTRTNVGSRQDAEELYERLRSLGWRHRNIVMLRDETATREMIEQAIAWLARKTNRRSVAVFHYSGHVKQWFDRDVDDDGEVPDEGLWPSDNDRIPDGEFVDRMAAVDAGRMWIDIGGCEAAGFADPGLRRPGRLLTFSSREPEKSYEDPALRNSVWGYHLVDRGLAAGAADRDGNRDVTVQEAFDFAAPRAARHTRGGEYGPQHPVIMDDTPRGGFSLAIPPPPQRRSGGGGGDGPGGDCQLPVVCDRPVRHRSSPVR